MATGPRYKVAFRRRREGRTDYYVRRKLLTAGEVRAVVRRSGRNISVQFEEFGITGDKVVASTISMELGKYGWSKAYSNIPAAYLTGYLAGKKALSAGIKYAVLDIGMQIPKQGGVLFAVVKGMCDAGLEVPHSEDAVPNDERIKGVHIDKSFADAVATMKEKMEVE